MRLIQTETTRLIVESDKDTFEEMGINQVEVVETLDRSTCDICSALDGQTMKRAEASAGSTAPPFHTNCRGIIVPHDVELSKDGHRTARDPETGKSIEIPDMPFKDWKAVYADKTKQLGEWKQDQKPARILALKQKVKKLDLSSCGVSDVVDIGKKLDDLFNIAGHLGDKDYLKEAFGLFREMGGEVQFEKGCSINNKRQISDAFSVYPKAWSDYLNDSGRRIYTKKVDRGFFYPAAVKTDGIHYETKFKNYKDGYVTIHMTGTRETTPFHEIGHMIEFFNSGALRISKSFVEHRTVGESFKLLSKIFEDNRYRDDEITKPDDFISPYIGKEYGEASEVLSMGLEQIFSPTSFVKRVEIVNGRRVAEHAKITDDKEYFYMILGLILEA